MQQCFNSYQNFVKFKTLYTNKYYNTTAILECPKATFPWTANNTR